MDLPGRSPDTTTRGLWGMVGLKTAEDYLIQMMTVIIMDLAACCQCSLDPSLTSIGETPDCLEWTIFSQKWLPLPYISRLQNTWGHHNRGQRGQWVKILASGMEGTLQQHIPVIRNWFNLRRGVRHHNSYIMGQKFLWNLIQPIMTFDSAALSSFKAGVSASVMAACGRPLPEGDNQQKVI